MKFKSRLVIILTFLMMLQSVLFGGAAFAASGSNVPNVTEYGLYNYVDNNTTAPTAVQVKSTGNDGETYNAWPWEALTQIPCAFDSNVGIGIKFAVNVATPTYWDQNATRLKMYDSANNLVAVNVIRLGNGESSDVNKNYIFVLPQGALQPSSSYKIVIDSEVTANNGQQAGKVQQVNFTTAGESTTPSSVSLGLNKPNAIAGASVIVSGTAEPNKWVSIQALDSASNIVVYNAVKSNASGSYSDTFKVPAVSPGIFNIVAGYGSNVATASLNVIPEATADTIIPSNSTMAITSNTPSGVTLTVAQDSSLNFAEQLSSNSEGGVSTDSLKGFNIKSDDSSPVQVEMTYPEGTIISAAAGWDGNSKNPTVQAANTVTVTPDSGMKATVSTVIEIGFGNVPLTFNKAVRILIPGEAGKDVGYYRNGTFTKISTVLSADSQAAGDALAAGGDGRIDVGSDLVIWTKHFTQFVTYTQTAGGSGGDSGSSSAPSWPSGSTLTGTKAEQVVTLTWTAATDNVGVTGYKIYMEDTEVATVDGSTLTCQIPNVDGQHIFKVQAVNAAGKWTTNGPKSDKIGGGGNNPLNYISSNLTSITGNVSSGGESVDGSSNVSVNPVIRIVFDRNVTGDAIWPANQQCFSMQDSSGTSVSIKVEKISNAVNFAERQHVFITPNSKLTAGKIYTITISGNLRANNGNTLGNNAVITFTVAGGAAITTAGPTITNGEGSVDPAIGATVGLGDYAKVVIPANALKGSSLLTVDVQKVASPPAAPVNAKAASDVYDFTIGNNSTYTFAGNVAITLSFNASTIGTDEMPVLFYYNETQNQWVSIGGTVSGSTITTQVNHFTKFGVFAVKKTEVVPVVPVIAVPAVTLTDIAGHWAEANINKLVAMGGVSGYSDGSFKPDENISRAEFVTVLVKAFKLETKSGKVFEDTMNSWAKDYIATATAYGITNGYNDQIFGANDLITREQMVVMVVKAAKLVPEAGAITFADSASISPWAQEAIATSIKKGIIKGFSDNTVRPGKNATRGEAITVIANALN
ncbi:MAG: hypothetical protein CVU90_10355 [Firmicutes bacterium HGW-Firmicutes-15]|nr:MAG: hypothetical protein CVU90_10355 [Firmicutes bacterium HGW-Firmicutes-15]